MFARREPPIEINCMEHRCGVQFDIAFLAQLARKRRKQGLSFLHPAAWEMPSGNIGVFDQEPPAFPVQDQAADTDREAARKLPINMEKHADKRLQGATDDTQCHAAIRLRSGLASPITMALKYPAVIAQNTSVPRGNSLKRFADL